MSALSSSTTFDADDPELFVLDFEVTVKSMNESKRDDTVCCSSNEEGHLSVYKYVNKVASYRRLS